jgi:pyruvate,orthophosphate dikinase
MDVAVMRVVRLKGLVTPEALAGAVGAPTAEVRAALEQLVGEGHVQERNGRYRVTRDGRDALDGLLAQEREGVDESALEPLYEEFLVLNAEFKDIAHQWQIRDGEPNDHADGSYDAVVLGRVEMLHERFAPLVERIVAITPPRVGEYRRRFDAALARVSAGEHDWLLKPLIDSYHTVWFELHEDLIGLLGLSREREAAEGRAE